MSVLDWIILLLYFFAMLSVGYWVYKKKISTFDDYYLAGRKLMLPALIGTMTSTYFGLDSVVGDSEMGFTLGASGLFAYPVVATAAIIILAIMGPSIKRRSREKRTPAEIVGDVYGHPARISVALGSAIYSFPIIGLMAMGFIASSALGVPYWLGVLVGAVIVVIYTYLGGMKAVAITDVFQFIIIGIGVGLGVIIMWNKIGNAKMLQGLREYLGDEPTYFLSPSGGWMTAGLFLTYAISTISVFCEPGLFQRIFAAKNQKIVRSAFIIGGLFYLLFGVCATFIGVLGAAAVGNGIFPADIHADEVLFTAAVQYLPIGILGIFLAGVLAAGMSTIDSGLLIGGANVSYDFYKAIVRPKAKDDDVIRVSRISMVVIAAVSVLLAFFFKRIMGAWVFISGLLINSTLVPLYVALYRKKQISRIGGNVAAVFGASATVVYYIILTVVGTLDPDWGTYILRIKLFGTEISLWQEYNVFIILPLVLIIYLIVHLCDRKKIYIEGGK